MSRVSVIVPHYGDPAPTLTLVEALRSQAGAPPHQVIVADDHSPIPFPATAGVDVVRRDRNGGFGSACNSGAAAATGELLLFLNSDLEIGPSFVSDLVEAAAPFQPCVAGSRMVGLDGATDLTARHFPTAAHQIIEWLTPLARFRHLRSLHEAVGHDMTAAEAQGPAVTDWLVGAVLLIPREEFERVGGFDERFHMNSEEVDLQRRLGENGLAALYVPSVSVVHEGGGASDPGRRRRWLVDSRVKYAEKWGGRGRLRAGLTTATLVNLAWNATRRARGLDVAPIRVARDELDLIWGKGQS